MGQADLRYHPNCHINDMTAQLPLTQDYAALIARRLRGGCGYFPRGLAPTDPSLKRERKRSSLHSHDVL